MISNYKKSLQKKAKIKMVGLKLGDVKSTYADVSKLIKTIRYKPITKLETGIKNFVIWFKEFYQ